jgi:hypothetical protein
MKPLSLQLQSYLFVVFDVPWLGSVGTCAQDRDWVNAVH